jgi:hypothetical protein
MFKDIDGVINNVGSGVIGNTKEIETTIKKGSIKINPANDTLVFEMKGRYQYSQPKQIYQEGDLLIYTDTDGKYFPITITLNYSGNYNITYNSLENQKMISKSATPYSIFVSKKGDTNVNIEVD